jgi:hypothetical protein
MGCARENMQLSPVVSSWVNNPYHHLDDEGAEIVTQSSAETPASQGVDSYSSVAKSLPALVDYRRT